MIKTKISVSFKTTRSHLSQHSGLKLILIKIKWRDFIASIIPIFFPLSKKLNHKLLEKIQ